MGLWRIMATAGMATAALMTFVGCGGGGGGGGGGSDVTDGLSRDIGLSNATFIVLDLGSKDFEPLNEIGDLTTNSTYKTSKMVFRRVSIAGGETIGSAASSFGFEADETQATVSAQVYFMAVFETTQAQWQALAGTTPWSTVLTEELSGLTAGADGLPLLNLSISDLESALSSYASGQDFTLRLPSDEEWELAARSGASTDYPWGDGPTSAGASSTGFDATTIALHARLQDSLPDGETGPTTVATMQVNGLGFYDMHGNVWEGTSERNIRGGAWRTPVAQARTADKIEFDEAIAHPSVGYRFVFQR